MLSTSKEIYTVASARSQDHDHPRMSSMLTLSTEALKNGWKFLVRFVSMSTVAMANVKRLTIQNGTSLGILWHAQ